MPSEVGDATDPSAESGEEYTPPKHGTQQDKAPVIRKGKHRVLKRKGAKSFAVINISQPDRSNYIATVLPESDANDSSASADIGQTRQQDKGKGRAQGTYQYSLATSLLLTLLAKMEARVRQSVQQSGRDRSSIS